MRRISCIGLFVLTLLSAAALIGCATAPNGPQWTYHVDPPYEPLAESVSPDIYYSSDLMQEIRTSSLEDESPIPPCTNLASVTGQHLDLDEMMAKARELGADGVILTRMRDTGHVLGVGSVDLGRQIAGVTFIKYDERAVKNERGKGLFQQPSR